ncbi:MAG TPA: protoporphyrinogen oxidase [Anaerolineales bacterium]|nr:protoporphyrinogen oxidase [Anaerolineales bacterium]
MDSIVIVGGGIAGLSAAYSLVEKAKSENRALSISVVETGDRWGGKIATDRIDGFVIEGGPDTFLRTKPWGVDLCRKLGLEERLHGTNPAQKNTYVLHSGRLKPLPEGLMMMIPTQIAPMVRTPLLTWPEKARMGLDFFLPARPLNGDESLGEFVSRRLGRAAYEKLIEPLMSGIYAGDGDQLSLQSTFPYLRDLEMKHGGLVKGALSVRKQRSRMSSGNSNKKSIFLTPTTGLAEIVEALIQYLETHHVQLHLNTQVTQISHNKTGYYQLDTNTRGPMLANGVILAAPAYISGSILSKLAPQLSRELTAIPYVSTATISLAYRQSDLPKPLRGYGYVIPKRESRQALACTWTSTKFPHRAPEGYALLRVFAGRAGQEMDLPWNDDDLLAIARSEVRHTLGIQADPVLSRVYMWEKAMPQYNLGHPERLKRIDVELTKFPGLALAGNGYQGIGIPDCIFSGSQAAEKVYLSLSD